MVYDNITIESGQQLDLKILNPIMGFQCEHVITGRLFPRSTRTQIYGWNAMVNHINNVVKSDTINLEEYYIVPMYFNELEQMESEFTIVLNEQDKKDSANNNLFI